MRIKSRNFLSVALLVFGLASCHRGESEKFNQLYITEKGDSLETGLWVFDPGAAGIEKRGYFKDGFRDGIWSYKTKTDSVSINWIVFKKDSLKINLPDYVEFTNQELPVLFLGQLREDTQHSYYALLRYDLKETKATVYDYIFQYIQSLENSSAERLERREVKKFIFNTVEVYRIKVILEGERKFQAVSYILTSNDILYDLTFREEVDKIDDLDLEIFNDILYSFQTNEFDPFDFNNKSYQREEIVDVRTPIQN